jgi:hypothetical protein
MVDVKPKEDPKVENPATHFNKPNDGVRPRQPSPERARVKAPADFRNCTRKTQRHLFRMK